MKTFDFGICSVYEKEEEFLKLLKAELRKKKKTFLLIDYDNINRICEGINKNKISFSVFLNLAILENPIFPILSEKLESKSTIVINSTESILKSFSKANLHEILKKRNLPLRKTFVIKSNEKTNLEKIPSSLGKPFVITPAVSSYESGPILNASRIEDINNAIEQYSPEPVLAQEYVLPKLIHERVAWFRIIYANGKIFPHFWDPSTHFYKRFGNSKEEKQIKNKSEKYLDEIADATGLKLFSTEIIIDSGGNYKVIDYANNPIDLSSQEFERDGVPKETLIKIAKAIAGLG